MLEKFADLRKWDLAQIQLNYFDWVDGTARKEHEILKERDTPIMVTEPVRGGELAAKLPESGARELKEAHPIWSRRLARFGGWRLRKACRSSWAE